MKVTARDLQRLKIMFAVIAGVLLLVHLVARPVPILAVTSLGWAAVAARFGERAYFAESPDDRSFNKPFAYLFALAAALSVGALLWGAT